MSTDPKAAASPAVQAQFKPMKIFTYPKIIFIWPTMFVSIICAIGMTINGDRTHDPTKVSAPVKLTDAKNPPAEVKVQVEDKSKTAENAKPVRRFSSPQNVFAMLFVVVFFLNLVIMSIDFPRFTVIGLILLAVALTFFLLWLNAWFEVLPVVVTLLESIFASANSTFYSLIAVAIGINFGFIYVSKYLDYWEILPNEILHNHGPFSDLERFPTTNLKFDKEIPDILEYALLRSGRLVLHIQNERKAIVLDNVLFIDAKEERLKQLMSRMEVRITSDKEADQPI